MSRVPVLRIGVDASCWSNRRGFGRFTRELLTALTSLDSSRNQYWFFVDQQTARESRFPSGIEVVEIPTQVQPIHAASASGRRSLSDVWKMSDAVGRHSLDLFFFPAIYSFFPIRNRARIAVTIHDMTPNRFGRSIFPRKKLEFFWNLKEQVALWQAHRIMTVSEYSKQQIMKHRGIDPARISVVTEAPGDAFGVLDDNSMKGESLSKYGIKPSDPYLLYVGGISPHKNLQFLARVFKELTDESRFSDHKLVLAGDFEKDSFYSDYAALQQVLEQLGIREKVIFTGYVDDTDLCSLYNSALLFVLPSLQEGFGLTAVEAMACGAAVVTSSASSLPEVVADAGVFFDPEDEKNALHMIRHVLLDEKLKNELQKKGLQRSKLFSWHRAAQQTLDIFDSMVKSGRQAGH